MHKRDKKLFAAQGVADEDAGVSANWCFWCRGHFIRYEDLHTLQCRGLLSSTGEVHPPIYTAHRVEEVFVFVDETRPRGQGARLTALELAQEGVPHAVIADNATGHYIKEGEIDMVIVGADRIAMNGDAANKIGTYTSALAAKAKGIPMLLLPQRPLILIAHPDPPFPLRRSGDEARYTWGWSDSGEFIRVEPSPKSSSTKSSF